MSVGGSKQARHLSAFMLLFLMDGDAHGGALWNRWMEITPAGWPTADSGAVYRVLRDLEQGQCVISSWDTEDSGPARRIYMITDKGKQMLSSWYEDITVRRKLFDYFISKYDNLAQHRAVGNTGSEENP